MKRYLRRPRCNVSRGRSAPQPRVLQAGRDTSARQFRTPVHCAELANDGLLYVCDRPSRPDLRSSRSDGTFVSEAHHRSAKRSIPGLDVGHRRSHPTPDQTLDVHGRRPEHEGLRDPSVRVDGRSSTASATADAQPGLFFAVHSIAVDSTGQHLHDRDLRGEAAAEVRVHGNGPCGARQPWRALAQHRAVGPRATPKRSREGHRAATLELASTSESGDPVRKAALSRSRLRRSAPRPPETEPRRSQSGQVGAGVNVRIGRPRSEGRSLTFAAPPDDRYSYFSSWC